MGLPNGQRRNLKFWFFCFLGFLSAQAIIVTVITSGATRPYEITESRVVPDLPVARYFLVAETDSYRQGVLFPNETVTRTSITESQVQQFVIESLVKDDNEQLIYFIISFLALSYDSILEDALRESLTILDSEFVQSISLLTKGGFTLTITNDLTVRYSIFN